MPMRYEFASRRRRPKVGSRMGGAILPMGRSDQPQGIAQAAAAPQSAVLATAPGEEGLAEMVSGLAQAQGERQEAEIERRARAIEAKEAREGRLTELRLGSELKQKEATAAAGMRREERAEQPSSLMASMIANLPMTPENMKAVMEYERALQEPQEERPPGFVGPPQATPAETFVETISQAGPPQAKGELDELPEIFSHFDDFDPETLDPELEMWSDKALQQYTPDQIVGAIMPLYRERLMQPWGGYGIGDVKVGERHMWGWRVNRKVENARKTLRAHLLKKIDGTE